MTEEGKARSAENGKLSTGPRTEEGKKTSSANSIQHGLYARLIFPPGMFARQALLDGFASKEPTEEFTALHQHLCTAFEPGDAFDRLLVEKMAVLLWRYRRLQKYERGQTEENLAALETELTPEERLAGHDDPKVARKAACRALPPDAALDRVLRVEAQLEKAFYRCYALLERRKSRVWRENVPPIRMVFNV